VREGRKRMRLRERGQKLRRGGGWRVGSGQSVRERKVWVERGLRREEGSKDFGMSGVKWIRHGEIHAR